MEVEKVCGAVQCGLSRAIRYSHPGAVCLDGSVFLVGFNIL